MDSLHYFEVGRGWSTLSPRLASPWPLDGGNHEEEGGNFAKIWSNYDRGNHEERAGNYDSGPGGSGCGWSGWASGGRSHGGCSVSAPASPLSSALSTRTCSSYPKINQNNCQYSDSFLSSCVKLYMIHKSLFGDH